MVEMLIAHGAEVDAKGTKNVTPLHLAAAAGHNDVVRSLLKHGASRDIRDDFGNSADGWATKAGHADIKAWLESNKQKTSREP